MKIQLHNKMNGRSRRNSRSAGRNFGFTLIELMIVISIILILVAIAAVNYRTIVKRAEEAVLQTNLRAMRDAIDHYTLDKEAAPPSVDDLRHAGYLRSVPLDPTTRLKDWAPVFDRVVLSPDQTTTGMTDVHSKSAGTALDGTKYSSW